MTGMEVAERKSVMRFLRTISLSALPGSRREEETAESWLLKSGDSCLVCNKRENLGRLVVKRIGEERLPCPDRLDLLSWKFRK